MSTPLSNPLAVWLLEGLGVNPNDVVAVSVDLKASEPEFVTVTFHKPPTLNPCRIRYRIESVEEA
jgi:hypothetical protein